MENIDRESLKSRLTPLQWRVTQEAGTERPFTGEYVNVKSDGTYRCIVCNTALFTSDTKYDSRSGWPSFYDVLDEAAVVLKEDNSLGMTRTEVECASCGAHLGHVFPDGPRPTGLRYCINSAALNLEAEASEPSEPE